VETAVYQRKKELLAGSDNSRVSLAHQKGWIESSALAVDREAEPPSDPNSNFL
jgi:hypothetical protein